MVQRHYIVTIALWVAKALGFNCILLVFQNQLIIIVCHTIMSSCTNLDLRFYLLNFITCSKDPLKMSIYNIIQASFSHDINYRIS